MRHHYADAEIRMAGIAAIYLRGELKRGAGRCFIGGKSGDFCINVWRGDLGLNCFIFSRGELCLFVCSEGG